MNATSETPQPRGYWGDAAVFFRSWMRTPGRTGAVLPSSRYLATAMTTVLTGIDDPDVAELGPGTGALTEAIQGRLGDGGSHVAVELNPEFAERLRRRFPNVDVVNDSATELVKILAERGRTGVDAVVSGLPFAAFPEQLQRDVLDAVVLSLRDSGGPFVTFNYVGAFSMPTARRFRGLLAERFAQIEISRPVLLNIPPAYVLTARDPR
ncbi:class I SAM-dependent methyltransferase [Stackebrandtia soli]|uniref:class I SAM-dependent methyltransferase n=1 Tax=Stackebrandtia soli TaxID=1892856 RepID=UPI0039EC62B3